MKETVLLDFPYDERPPYTYSPLALAYIGDTVYDLYVRTLLLHRTDKKPHALHMASANLVCAAGQARAYLKITAHLTETEQMAFRRGRNAHSGTLPKNATSAEYHIATGLESLLGYLYVAGDDERIRELMTIALREEV